MRPDPPTAGREIIFLPKDGARSDADAQPPIPSPGGLSHREGKTESWATSTPASTDNNEHAATGTIRETIGRYQILRTLGVGGMGKVFEAWDPELGRSVAVKMIKATAGEVGGTQIAYFKREGRALAQIRHTNIVQVYDARLHEDPPYLVMEYVAGQTLQGRGQYYAEHRREAVALMEKIARAVHYLHEHDLVHRDLKLANVLLDVSGEPKVSDFGLVKFLEQGSETIATAGTVGTPPYMAPEQTGLTGQPVSRRTDVWALGIMLYRLLSGRMPFEDKQQSRLFYKICHQPCPAPNNHRAELDRGLAAVILKCLRKGPAERFATAEQLADELRRWLNGEPLQTKPDTLRKRAWRLIRGHPVAAVSGTVFALALATILIAFYLSHPDRPLYAIQGRLAVGEPVTLIGETGMPMWSQWQLDDPGTLSRKADGTFSAQCWGTGLLALAKQVPCDEFVYRAQVKHTQGDLLAEVGLYFLLSSQEHEGARITSLMRFTFNDIVDTSKVELLFPLPTAGEGNPVRFQPWLITQAPNRRAIQGNSGSGVKPPLLKPAGPSQASWHDLVVHVSPLRLHAVFDGQAIGPASIEYLQTKCDEEVGIRLGTDGQLPKGFTRHETVGLFVRNATASFRNVVIEPATGTKEPTN